MKNVLISSLGQSPGVVTGTVDALKFFDEFDEVDIHKVTTVSTCHHLVLNYGIEMLASEFRNDEIYPQDIKYCNKYIESEDIFTPDDNKAFLTLIVDEVKENLAQDQVGGIYFNLAGGRKTMSALMMTAVKIFVDCYGSWQSIGKFKEITHLLVNDDEIENYGDIKNLLDSKTDNPELFFKCMHPTMAFSEEEAKQKVRLIPLSKSFREADKMRTKYLEWLNDPNRETKPDPMDEGISNYF